MKGESVRKIGFAQRERKEGKREFVFFNVSRPSALFRPRSDDPGRKG
jgi:hypothetical protein